MKLNDYVVNPLFIPSEIEKRVVPAQSWIDGVEHVIEITNNKDAKMLALKYLEDAAVYKPDSNNFNQLLQAPKRVSSMVLIPLFYWDKNSGYLQSTMVSHQMPIMRSYGALRWDLYFNADVDVSPRWKGLIMLHELERTYLDNNRVYHKDLSEQYEWFEEVEAFAYSHSLLKRIYGPQYDNYVESVVMTLMIDYEKTSNPANLLPSAILDVTKIEEILGASLSEEEKLTHQVFVWVDVIFRILDKRDAHDTETRKAYFLKDYLVPESDWFDVS